MHARSTRRRKGRLAAALAGVSLAATPLAAQESWEPSRPPLEGDVATLDGILDAFYDIVSGPAGQPRDWARDSTLYLPGLRFVVVSRDADGRHRARSFDHGAWAEGSSEALAAGFYEREIHRVTRRFGPMMDVFSTYEWSREQDGPVGGRGINSIQLFHDGERWWIAGAMWASEDPDTPIPEEFLPDGPGPAD